MSSAHSSQFIVGQPAWLWWDAADGYVESKIISTSQDSSGILHFKLEVPSKGHFDPSSPFTLDWQPSQDIQNKHPRLLHMNPPSLVGSANLTELSHLNEQEVLRSLQHRYKADQVYTKSGLILVSLNPFKVIPSLYSEETKQFFRSNIEASQEGGNGPPHVFAVAEEALRDLKINNRNHSIIINGESGSGKTVAAKYILQYYTEESQQSSANPHSAPNDIEHRLLGSNPILEALGNAKTQRNENSSRFGKYMRLEFDEKYSISGAFMETYLLEKSRLCSHSVGERNFHIFYQMFAGSDAKFRQSLRLTAPSDYSYLQPYAEEDLGDAKCFQELLASLELFGMNTEMQFQFFSTLAGILHLGNVQITGSADESFVSETDAALQDACKLLGLPANALRQVLIERKIQTRDGLISAKNSRDKALEYRDAIAKYVYLRLFSWTLAFLNKSLSSTRGKSKQYIGILDIYGFEFFKTNSLEQFCINYANEKLQQEFNKHFFKQEQAIYQREGIPMENIHFNDNQPCIDLIEGKGGIVDQLDEQAKVAFGTDQKFRDGLFVKPNDFLVKPKIGTSTFEVKHFASSVQYDVAGFVDKNRDAISQELIDLLRSTTNSFLLQTIVSDESMSKGSGSKVSVLSAFKESLGALCTSLAATEPHYVRCIKPNDKFQNLFDPKYTLQQLLACGIIEAVKMAIAGYPTRRTLIDMIDRFGVMVDRTGKSNPAIVNEIFSSCSLQVNSDYAVGKTMAFMRIGVLARLEHARDLFYSTSIKSVAGHFHCKKVRNEFLITKSRIYRLIELVRAAICRSKLNLLRYSSSTVQRLLRLQLIKRILRPSVVIQRSFRAKSKRTFLTLYCRTLFVQSCFRAYLIGKDFKLYLFTCMVQRTFRCKQKKGILYSYLIAKYCDILQHHVKAALVRIQCCDPSWKREAKRSIDATQKKIRDAEFARRQLEEQRAAEEEFKRQAERREKITQHESRVKSLSLEEDKILSDLIDLETQLSRNTESEFDVEKGQRGIADVAPLPSKPILNAIDYRAYLVRCMLVSGIVIAFDAFALFLTHRS